MIDDTATDGTERGPRVWVFGTVLAILLVAMIEVTARLVGNAVAARIGLDVTSTDRILVGQTAALTTLLEDPSTLVVLDSALGWRYRPHYRGGENQLNAEGMRSTREYLVAREPGRQRIAAFGDSFVYGTEVSNADSWATVLETTSDSLEVLNYGVGGYGTDQAFLRFLDEGMRHSPDVVLIGFAPVNLPRIQNVYRRFIASDDLPIVKPRFVFEQSRLAVLPPPLRTRADYLALRDAPARVSALSAHDAWYEPLRYESRAYRWSAAARFGIALGYRVWRKYGWEGRLLVGGEFREASGAFALQRAVLNAFADSVRARGARPVFVLFPDDASVTGYSSGAPPVYAPLRRALEQDDRAPVIDLIEDLGPEAARVGSRLLFAPGRHYSARGNAVVSASLARRLKLPPVIPH
ncbi:MAG TPA: SGNH/GDSL hydrolase family protein [Gemmatimonas sp.]|nr:SGNH/GDSL hydrolase family protein [Gemmatimonas sp.]